MRILGIDPGLNITGYGLIESNNGRFTLIEAGIIKTSQKLKIEARLQRIFRALVRLIRDTHPEAVILEKLYSHYRHPLTACLLGHARGVICLCASTENVDLFEYPATRVKKVVSGRGNASKQQIQHMVQHTFGVNIPGPADVSDALALAIAHTYIVKRKI